jgi:hypothetical protein
MTGRSIALLHSRSDGKACQYKLSYEVISAAQLLGFSTPSPGISPVSLPAHPRFARHAAGSTPPPSAKLPEPPRSPTCLGGVPTPYHLLTCCPRGYVGRPVQHAIIGVQHPLQWQSHWSLPAHTSLRSVLPSVQHPLPGHKPGEPPRSPSLRSSCRWFSTQLLGFSTPSSGKATGASPLTPRFARFCRRFSIPSPLTLASLGYALGLPCAYVADRPRKESPRAFSDPQPARGRLRKRWFPHLPVHQYEQIGLKTPAAFGTGAA